MLTTERHLIIDEEGYFIIDGKRMVDEEVGAMLLEGLQRKERGTFSSQWDDDEVFMEAFDEPLIVQWVDIIEADLLAGQGANLADAAGSTMKLTFPYGAKAPLDFSKLRVDEWDRFHGRTPAGIPYVFSRKAQARFFDLLEEYDDDSITWLGKTYEMKPWMTASEEIGTADYWTEKYKQGRDGWELGTPAAALTDMLPRLKMPKSRVLVPGCGRGHDAALFAEAGQLVTAVDISPEALKEAKALYGHLQNITWLEADIFEMGDKYAGQFDMIFEHTCYCAVDPERRAELVKNYTRMLAPSGQLMGVFFVVDRPNGPPFGGTEWELRERLRKRYEFQFWGRWKASIPSRKGMELFVLARKLKSSF